MEKIRVYFEFNTKEEWVEFGNKFYFKKEFEPYIPQIDYVKRFESVDEMVDELNLTSCVVYELQSLQTNSKKILELLNEFIKENHYEKYYKLRDKDCNKIYMSLDELLKQI